MPRFVQVELVASNGGWLSLRWSAAQLSGLIKERLQVEEEQEQEQDEEEAEHQQNPRIQVDMDEATLRRVAAFMEQYDQQKYSDLAENIVSASLTSFIHEPWYLEFAAALTDAEIQDLLVAANYMSFDGLLDFLACVVASRMLPGAWGRKAIMDGLQPLDEKEESKVLLEHPWIL